MSMETLKFEPNEYVYNAGDDADRIFIIKKGSLELTAPYGDQEIYGGVLKEGDVFGESAAVKGRKRLASVRTLEDVVLAYWDQEQIISALDNPVSKHIVRLLCERVEMLYEMLVGIRSTTRKPGDESRDIIIKPGNMKVEDEIQNYSIRVDQLPFSLETSSSKSVVKNDGIELNADTTNSAPGNCISINLKDGMLYCTIERGEASLNGIQILGKRGSTKISLQGGPSILALGKQNSLARFIILTSVD